MTPSHSICSSTLSATWRFGVLYCCYPYCIVVIHVVFVSLLDGDTCGSCIVVVYNSLSLCPQAFPPANFSSISSFKVDRDLWVLYCVGLSLFLWPWALPCALPLSTTWRLGVLYCVGLSLFLWPLPHALPLSSFYFYIERCRSCIALFRALRCRTLPYPFI